MPRLFVLFFGSVLRWGLSLLAGSLIAHGVLSPKVGDELVVGLVMALLPLLWGLWQKYKSRLKFLTALELPAQASEEDVKDILANSTQREKLQFVTRKSVSQVLLCLLLPFALLLQGCPKQNTTKVADIVQAARAFATANVALGVSDQIVEILGQDATVSAEQGQVVYKASERIRVSLDRVRGTINSGVWDQRELYALLDNALAEVARLEADLGIKNAQSRVRFQEYVSLLRYGITAASQIVKQLKPPRLPPATTIEADANRPAGVESLTTNQVTEIIGVSTVAAIKIIQIRGMHAEEAWRLAADESKAIHDANAQRLQ